MAFDLEDPSTWPTDDHTLAELANGIPDASDPSDVAPELAATPESADTTPAQPDAPATEQPRDEQGRFTKAETDEAPVLTADGKHYIPHTVLKETRERAQQAEQQLHEREQQLAQYQQQLAQYQQQLAQQSAPPVTEPTQAAPLGALLETPVTLTTEEQTKVDQVRRDWGEDQAEALRQSYLAMRRTEVQDQVLRQYHQALAEQRQVMAEMQARLAQQQQAEQQSEGEQIQMAIDASPLMAAWQADRNSPYFDLSVKLHQYLLNSDAEYARLSWTERMNLLPAKVQALHGQSPHASQVGAVGAVQKPAPVQAAEPRIPLSHSDIAAGGTPPALNDLEKLERLTPAQLQNQLARMEPGELRDYLMQFG